MPCYCLGSELTGSAGSVTGSAGCCPLLPKRLGTERSGLPAEPVVKGRGGELLGGTLYELAPRYEGVPLPDLSTLTVSAPTLMPCTR